MTENRNTNEYMELRELFRSGGNLSSFRTAVDGAVGLSAYFTELHEKGECIQGFHPSGVGIMKNTGEIRIDPKLIKTREEGSLPIRYAPPEINLGVAKPGEGSDRYILAVLIFQLLTGGDHPLHGSRYMGPVMTKRMKEMCYGLDPEFIFSDSTGRNLPDPKIHVKAIAIWNILPGEIRALFARAFSREAVLNPEKRPDEKEWNRSLVAFQNHMIPCQCGNILKDGAGESFTCTACGKGHQITHRIKIDGDAIPVVRGNRIYRSQVRHESLPAADEARPEAIIVVSGSDHNKMGLRNVSEDTWKVLTTKGITKDVGKGEVVPIKSGIKIRCGDTDIEIAATDQQ